MESEREPPDRAGGDPARPREPRLPDTETLEAYLSSLYECEVTVIATRELGGDADDGALKSFGYGDPVLIEFHYAGGRGRVVLHTMTGDGFGHERRSDRARDLLLDYDTFNELPRHVRALDVGAFGDRGELVSLGRTGEFFLVTRFAAGEPYAGDLERIARTGEESRQDHDRAAALAAYLAGIHESKHASELLYRRRVRDLVGHGEGIAGILDSYPDDDPVAPPERLQAIERRCLAWRWRLRGQGHRLCEVHGDFHPWNVLFREGDDFALLDRSRGRWGEPGDDVSSMAINYLLHSLRAGEPGEGPFGRLHDTFWFHYLQRTQDQELLRTIQPFFAWRALVLASPVWYPDQPETVREQLFCFMEQVLERDRFEPRRLEECLPRGDA